MHRQEIKGNLARLLATENLIVEHRRSAPTASFDVERRVLTLPAWDRASSVVYDLLVGHEVGHALFTPNLDWTKEYDCPKDFINVVEDARIERLMKRKYPGLRKSFSNGYAELDEQDFFDTEGTDLDRYSLIDRINLHFKIGASSLIPFNEEEKVFINRIENLETFEEVCKIAVEIYEFSKKKEPENPETIAPSTSGSSKNQSSDSSDESTIDSESQPDETENSGSPSEDEDDDSEDETQEDGGGSTGGTSRTQDAFDKAAETLSSKSPYIRNTNYVEIPDSIDLNNIVVDWKDVHDWTDECRERFSKDYEKDAYAHVDYAYKEFRKSSVKEVNYLVKEFECRKSADAYARAATSRTGVLDTTKLHTYRYNEDLFKKVTVIPDGKNHGLLFVLDWSGSMQYELLATIKQLLNLTTFCRKVQIPFEVYAFTNEWRIVRAIKGEDFESDRYSSVEEGKVWVDPINFNLLNIISSRSNNRDYERQCMNIWREVYRFTYHTWYRETPGLGLSGTPLNEAIVSLNYIIPEFKRQNDLQKVNVCILTDGDSCMIGYGKKIDAYGEETQRPIRVQENCTLRDRKTGIVYSEFRDSYTEVTTTFISQLRDRNPGVNVIGFRILRGAHLSNFVSRYGYLGDYNQIHKQWKKEKSAVIRSRAYNALYAIQQNSVESSSDFEVADGAKKGEISRAFKKMLNAKSSNKKVLSSFIDYVA